MTKSNNEWLFKVGELVEHFDDYSYCEKEEILAIKDSVYVLWNPRLKSVSQATIDYIRPIQTEAEKRREERIDLLAGQIWQLTPALKIESAKILASNLVADNWIKPKPLTDGLIGRLYHADTKIFVSRIDAYIRGELEL